jgi:hypothetical protein
VLFPLGAAHAAAGIEYQAYCHRLVFHGEAGDHLLQLVVENPKVFLVQAGYRTIIGVVHRHRDQHLGAIHAQVRPWYLIGRFFVGFLPRWNRYLA